VVKVGMLLEDVEDVEVVERMERRKMELISTLRSRAPIGRIDRRARPLLDAWRTRWLPKREMEEVVPSLHHL